MHTYYFTALSEAQNPGNKHHTRCRKFLKLPEFTKPLSKIYSCSDDCWEWDFAAIGAAWKSHKELQQLSWVITSAGWALWWSFCPLSPINTSLQSWTLGESFSLISYWCPYLKWGTFFFFFFLPTNHMKGRVVEWNFLCLLSSSSQTKSHFVLVSS